MLACRINLLVSSHYPSFWIYRVGCDSSTYTCLVDCVSDCHIVHPPTCIDTCLFGWTRDDMYCYRIVFVTRPTCILSKCVISQVPVIVDGMRDANVYPRGSYWCPFSLLLLLLSKFFYIEFCHRALGNVVTTSLCTIQLGRYLCCYVCVSLNGLHWCNTKLFHWSFYCFDTLMYNITSYISCPFSIWLCPFGWQWSVQLDWLVIPICHS